MMSRKKNWKCMTTTMVAASAAADMLYLALGLATASISITMTKTPMFAWASNLSTNKWWRALWACPYCMSHWIAMFFVAVYRPMDFGMGIIDLFVAVFIIVTIAATFISILNIAGLVASWLKLQGAKNS
jgi:hypothetical protein